MERQSNRKASESRSNVCYVWPFWVDFSTICGLLEVRNRQKSEPTPTTEKDRKSRRKVGARLFVFGPKLGPEIGVFFCFSVFGAFAWNLYNPTYVEHWLFRPFFGLKSFWDASEGFGGPFWDLFRYHFGRFSQEVRKCIIHGKNHTMVRVWRPESRPEFDQQLMTKQGLGKTKKQTRANGFLGEFAFFGPPKFDLAPQGGPK